MIIKKLKNNLDKLGFLGTLFSALCCIGCSSLISLLGIISAGFLINDLILIPFLVISLGFTIWGEYLSFKVHKRRWVLVFCIISSIVILSGIWISKILVYLGLIALLLSLILSFFLKRKCDIICGGELR